MVPGSRTTRQSPCVNPPANILRKQNELAGVKSDAGSDEAPTPPEAPSLLLIPLPSEDLFTKFMKVFIETT